MGYREDELSKKTAHFWLPSVAQKRRLLKLSIIRFHGANVQGTKSSWEDRLRRINARNLAKLLYSKYPFLFLQMLFGRFI